MLWDPFDFEEGVINEFIDVVVNGTETITLLAKDKSHTQESL